MSDAPPEDVAEDAATAAPTYGQNGRDLILQVSISLRSRYLLFVGVRRRYLVHSFNETATLRTGGPAIRGECTRGAVCRAGTQTAASSATETRL